MLLYEVFNTNAKVAQRLSLNEGGAAKGVGAIHHSEIAPTLKKLEQQLGVPLLANALGSVGKKEFSGDIDIAVELNKEQQDDFQKKLQSTPGLTFVQKTSVFITSADIVGYDPKKQIPGVKRTGKVQIDFMPGDVEFMKNYYHSPHSKSMSQDGRHSAYKGVHRNLMISAIIDKIDVKASKERTKDGRPLKLARWMFSPTDGIVRIIREPVPKANGEGYTKKNKNTITKGPFKKPEQWAKILKLDSADDLYSFETLLAAVKKNYPAETVSKVISDFKSNPTIQKAGVPSELGESVNDTITEVTKEGARIQHIEDFGIWFGSKGIAKSINTLKELETKPESMTVKWDGSPAVMFGRNEKGEFVLTDKSGFSAKGYDGKVTSPQAMADMFLSRGKDAPDANRKAFVQKMANVWSTYESAVPKDFRGYVHGDLLFFTTPPVNDGYYEFTPNVVTYRVKQDSPIGKEIAQSTSGVVLHQKVELDGSKSPVDATQLNAGRLLIMPPVSITTAPKIKADNLDKIAGVASQHAASIDKMLDDATLKANKLASFKDVIYKYINTKTKQRQLNNLAGDWNQWLENEPKISAPMKQRIGAHVQDNKLALKALFTIIAALMQVKNDIINQLDSAETDVQAYTNGKRGGEGYVVGQGDSKLVNRSGFSAANMDKDR